MPETLDVKDLLPNKFEPKRQNRWVLSIEGIDAFLVKTAKRPAISFNENTLEFINSTAAAVGALMKSLVESRWLFWSPRVGSAVCVRVLAP